MKAEKLVKLLIGLNACSEAMSWVDGNDAKSAWNSCGGEGSEKTM